MITDAKEFSADTAWGARLIAEVEGATVRLHWTDKPYKWHINEGTEVFVVIDGIVDMQYRENGDLKSVRLTSNDIFVAGDGDDPVAHPLGEARLLVVERKGSV